MKLFVVVVMFAVVPFVFADDVMWQVAPPFSLMPGASGQESSETPKNRMSDSDEKQTQAQDSQQNAGNKPILKTEPETKRTQAADQQSDGSVNPDEEASGPWDWLYAVRYIVLVFAVPLIALLTYRMGKKANARTEEHRERTERFAYIKERPKLTFVEWELTPHDRGKSRTIDDPRDTVRCETVNMNGALATLGGIYEKYWVVDELPPAPNFRQKLSNRLKGKMLSKGDRCSLLTEQIPTVDWKAVKKGEKMLYAFFYVEYSDDFGGQHEACSLMRYQGNDFVSEEHPGYTCNT